MSVDIGLSARGENYLTFSLGYAGAPGTLDLQYGTRRDFQHCIAPVLTIGAAGAATLTGFNRGQTYWMRGRVPGGDWSAARAFATLPGPSNFPAYGIQIQPAQIILPVAIGRWYASAGTQFGYPASNLGRAGPTTAWRAGAQGGAVSFWMESDGSPIDTIALLDTNLPEGARIAVIAADTLDAVTGGGQYATAAQAFRASPNLAGRRGYHGVVRLPAPVAYRFWRVEISGEMPPLGLVHATHAVFGQARTIKNYSDLSEQPFDLGTFERTRDGNPDAVAGFRGKRVDFELALMTESQHEAAFSDLTQRIGATDPVFIIPNSREGAYRHDRLLYGNLTTNRVTNSNARFTRSLGVESIIN